jgi:hypothetical protein
MIAFIDDHREAYGVEPVGNVPPAEAEQPLPRHPGTTSHGSVTQTLKPNSLRQTRGGSVIPLGGSDL